MLIPSIDGTDPARGTSLSRRVNANSQQDIELLPDLMQAYQEG